MQTVVGTGSAEQQHQGVQCEKKPCHVC